MKSRLILPTLIAAMGAMPMFSARPRNGEAAPEGRPLRIARRGTRRTSGTPEQNAQRVARAIAKRERKALLRLERAA